MSRYDHALNRVPLQQKSENVSKFGFGDADVTRNLLRNRNIFKLEEGFITVSMTSHHKAATFKTRYPELSGSILERVFE